MIRFFAGMTLFGLLISGASFAAAQDKAEELLKAKGIRKLAAGLALAEENDLTKKLAEIPKLKKAVIDANNELATAEKKAADTKQLISVYSQQRREIRAQLEKTSNVNQYNKLVNALNELGDRITLIENADLTKETKEARDKSYQAREAYLQHVLDMRKFAEKIARQYTDLAEDPEVKSAIEQLNKETGKTFALVESRTFQANVKSLKKLEDSVLSETIALRGDTSNTYYAPVVLNGKHTKELAVDSGSSLICLPHKMAVEVGAEPKSTDEEIRLVLADGREVMATRVMLTSVRVGKFTLENVECAVMPETLPNAAPLLGMSYLRHFSFKIDSDTSKLTMSKIDTPAPVIKSSK